MNFEGRIMIDRCTTAKINDEGIEPLVDHNIVRFKISVENRFWRKKA